jgi:hypothetical protein
MKKKIYYPLRSTKGTYREPGTVYLSILCSDDYKFLMGAYVGAGDPVVTNNPGDIIKWFLTLDNKTWILTYDMDYIPAILEPLLDHYSISGYGEDTSLITLEGAQNTLYLIDGVMFFLEPLFKITGRYNREDPGLKVLDIRETWENFRYYLKDLYGIHPSKTPGASALKSWRPIMPRAFKRQGNPITKFSSYGVTSGALHWKNGYYKDTYLYDINAAYPYAMAMNKYPVRTYVFHNREPGPRFIAAVNLDYVSYTDFSPLAVRLHDGSIVHPSIAENTRAILTHYDRFILEQSGDLKINSWIEGLEWGPDDEDHIFLDWAAKLENYILTNPGSKIYLKVVSRALHSKFAQRAGAPIVTIKKTTAREVLQKDNVQDIYPLPNGDLAAKFITRKRPGFQAYIRPDWEILTLAYGRYLLYSRMDPDTVYMDTDCIISTKPRPDLDIGPNFGLWKLSKQGPCYIAGPRMYVIDNNPKASGIHAGSKEDLIIALKDATRGVSTILQSMEKKSLTFPVELERYRDHTITRVNYPFVTTIGSMAYVTRSPTTPHKLKPIGRILR